MALIEELGLSRPKRALMPCILIVDDDADIRRSIAELAKEAGYITIEARDADQALRVMERGRISVVLTDWHMPGLMDGFELAGRVSEKWPEVRLIITSGWVIPLPGIPPPGAEFLAKPFSEKSLAKLLLAAA